MENHIFDDFLNELQRTGISDISLEQAEKLIPYYIELNINTRMPANNGFTPVETEKMRDELQFVSESLFVSEIRLDRNHETERMNKAKKQNQEMRKMTNLFKLFVFSEQVKNNPSVKRQKSAETIPVLAEVVKNTRNAAEDNL